MPIQVKTGTVAGIRKEHKVIISVVRDEVLYRRLVAENPMISDCEKRMLDNREENLGIPTRYNQFLETYNYEHPAWLVFCHEDFEFRQNLSFLDTLPADSLYGPIGTLLSKKREKWQMALCGEELCSNRDGSRRLRIGARGRYPQQVLTFDCQCIIIHSDLVQKCKLRFDEKLTYDLYVEDFCISSLERHGIPSLVVPIDCQHYSYGNLQPRFFKGLAYLQEKWYGAQQYYVSTIGLVTIGGQVVQRVAEPEPEGLWRRAKRFVFQAKRTGSGRLLVKLFRIPVWWKK